MSATVAFNVQLFFSVLTNLGSMLVRKNPSAAPLAKAVQLHRDGYVLLRGAIPARCLNDLRLAFDAGIKPSDQWPVPRGGGWCHALLDLVPEVQAVCRLPELLDAAGTLIGERFFLAQVEGREPMAGAGHQALHRDLCGQRPGDTVVAIAYLDDYGPDNGATRIVPGSHHCAQPGPPFDFNDVSQAVQICGCAGDILVFDADLVHAGSVNTTGARRRSLLMGYFAGPLYASHLATAALRGVRMDAPWFDLRPVEISNDPKKSEVIM